MYFLLMESIKDTRETIVAEDSFDLFRFRMRHHNVLGMLDRDYEPGLLLGLALLDGIIEEHNLRILRTAVSPLDEG